MDLSLPPRFTFADFRRATPLDEASLLELIVERHDARITVKRTGKAHDNLQKIFDVTFRLANKVGFAAMTLRDLSRETGLSMGGLYGYIASKDDLSAMIEDAVRYVGEALPTWFAGQADPRDRLDSMLRGHVFMSELLQPWFYFVFMESRTLSGHQKSVARSAELHFQEQIARQIKESGTTDARRTRLLASHYQALIQDWYVKRWKYKSQGVTVDEFANSISRWTLLEPDLGPTGDRADKE